MKRAKMFLGFSVVGFACGVLYLLGWLLSWFMGLL